MVEEACVLKEAVDHVVRWQRASIGERWIEDALACEGLRVPRTWSLPSTACGGQRRALGRRLELSLA